MNYRSNRKNVDKIKKLKNSATNGRDFWSMARIAQDQDGFAHNPVIEIMYLQEGANRGDVWSMCELARSYYLSNVPELLPLALSWWRKAVHAKDNGAVADLGAFPIADRIDRLMIRGASYYAMAQMKCALFTEWYLTDMGRTSWDYLPNSDREARIRQLCLKVAEVLQIKEFEVFIDETLSLNGQNCDGVSYPEEWRIGLSSSAFKDYEKLVQVLFHEIGHLLLFSMWNESEESVRLRQIYRVSDSRIDAWHHNRKDPDGEAATENDADMLGYGVYQNWVACFGLGGHSRRVYNKS